MGAAMSIGKTRIDSMYIRGPVASAIAATIATCAITHTPASAYSGRGSVGARRSSDEQRDRREHERDLHLHAVHRH